ncbi:MAG: amidohydrolase family protein [Rhodospirillaceae bacterium]|nr:amidohydrolase family protein [Rhodospirillaceae bacterium]
MLFDSLSHPTLDGTWIGGKPGESFAAVADNLRRAGAIGACAVGLPGIGGYEHQAYFAAAQAFPQLFPVAAYTGRDGPAREVERIAKVGFKALKVHPRLLGVHPKTEMLAPIFAAARANGVTVFLCTYYHDKPGRMIDEDPYWHLVRAVNQNPDTRLVLVHGGGVRLMEYAELCRFSPNILLDLSFTVQKYGHSAVGQNLAFLAETFDRRICIGSDSPEYDVSLTRALADRLTERLPAEKRRNILYRNISTFVGHPVAAEPAAT